MKPIKCKYADECEMYSEESPTCTETGGMYYGRYRPAGCYIYMENQ